MALTERQQAVLRYIQDFIRQNEYPPSIREIMEDLDISSTSVVNYNLNVLVKEGFISRHKELARGIRLVDGSSAHAMSRNIVRIPILGRIVAGAPVPVPDTDFDTFSEEALELTRSIVRDDKGIYALQVSGESMIDALINDGDVVVMKQQSDAHNGDLVAVWLKDEKETTLKRFYLEGDRVRLQPANPYMDPIYTPANNVQVQGKVIVVIRQMARLTN